MTPTEALAKAVEEHGVRGLARMAGVSASFVSGIMKGRTPMPTTGRLAEYLGIKVVTKVTVER